jgi:molecular chaperone IbpA
MEDVAMRNYDFAPFWRSTVGFDRLFSMLEDEASRMSSDHTYPPYNIERTGEDTYEVALALAGFAPDEITITAEQDVLTIDGRKPEKSEHHYLYQGISARPFHRQFNLADYVEVAGATFDNGLLRIQLERKIPEAMKPRRIEIKGTTQPRHMDQLKAA